MFAACLSRAGHAPTGLRRPGPARLGLGATLSAACILAAASGAQAQTVRTPAPGGFPISSLVSTPASGRIVWVSGTTAPAAAPGASMGDTTAQTVATLKRIGDLLATQGMGLGDIDMVRIYLVGDPAHGGKMDFPGMMVGWKQFFGTSAQPNLPARTTVQVAGLAGPGALVEIEAQAVKSR